MPTIPERLRTLTDAWRANRLPPAPYLSNPGVVIYRTLVGGKMTEHLDALVEWMDSPLAHGECSTACIEQHTYVVPCVLADQQAPALAAEVALADELADALRLTAEWSMAVALPGWSWFDALQRYHAARGHAPLEATGLPCGVTSGQTTGTWVGEPPAPRLEWLPDALLRMQAEADAEDILATYHAASPDAQRIVRENVTPGRDRAQPEPEPAAGAEPEPAAEPRQDVLRGALKAAHEQLCRAQPQCVIVACRSQLQRALDIIDNVAHQEGVEPGDTFAPGDDVVDATIQGEFTDAEAAMVAALAHVRRVHPVLMGRAIDNDLAGCVRAAAQVVRMAKGADTPGWDEADVLAALHGVLD